MESERPKRRSEPRYPVEAKAIVHTGGGGSVSAVAADISSHGMLLRVERPSDFQEGERVTVDVEAPDNPVMPFSAWGSGTVVRSDGSGFAVRLQAGTFDGPEEGAPKKTMACPTGTVL
jgi:hypothetical protein